MKPQAPRLSSTRRHLRLLQALTVLGLLAISVPRVCLATPTDDARTAIQSVYDKMATAARWKFLDGMFSGRAPDFSAAGPNGSMVNLVEERATLTRLLQQSAAVSEKTTIERINLTDPTHATCHVHDITIFTVDRPDGTTAKLTLDTLSDDHWVKSPDSGWLESFSRVLSQTSVTDPPMNQ